MKSYGRALTFLLLTGPEQARSAICALTGDMEGARDLQLVLPEPGVCSTDLGGSSCCTAEDTEQAAPVPGSCGIASPCTSPATVASAGAPAGAGLPVASSGGCE